MWKSVRKCFLKWRSRNAEDTEGKSVAENEKQKDKTKGSKVEEARKKYISLFMH